MVFTNSFEILNRCQSELSHCDINEIDRLHLEMCIIRAKLLLLESDKTRRNELSVRNESEIRDLYARICMACGPDGDAGEVGEIIERLERVIRGMKGTI